MYNVSIIKDTVKKILEIVLDQGRLIVELKKDIEEIRSLIKKGK